MTGSATEQITCAKCGADVRAEAQFCYNCGGAVEPIDARVDSNSPSDAWLRGDISDTPKPEISPPAPPIAAPVDVPLTANDEKASSEENLPVEKTSEKPAIKRKKTATPKNAVKTKPKLKSAASLRKKPKSIQHREVEVSWSEKEHSANIWFILVSVLITLLAVGVLFLAMYLK